jgi:predicted nucleotidyltransferase
VSSCCVVWPYGLKAGLKGRAMMNTTIQNLTQRTGLSPQITESIKAEVKRFPEVRAAYLFGSRARGDFRDQSDIDIAIDAPTMTASHFAQLWNAIDALPIAFPLDCVWLQAMPASALKSMVQRDALAL